MNKRHRLTYVDSKKKKLQKKRCILRCFNVIFSILKVLKTIRAKYFKKYSNSGFAIFSFKTWLEFYNEKN